MTITDFIASGSLIIAVTAFIYTYISNTKKYELTSQYRKEILNWYSITVEILIRLRNYLNEKNINNDIKNDLLSKLSSQIEIGRFYFPNVDKKDNYGSSKPSAYKGYRNLMLDFLVFSYQIFEKHDANRYSKHAEVLQRHFTSHLFDILDPKQYLKDTKKYTKKLFSKDLCFEDFIDNDPDAIDKYL